MPDTPTALFLAFQEAVAGRFSLDREIGRGGMGVVYLAREVRLDRLVAIKVLPPAFADSPALRERFLREARTAARLSHPNIVPIHAVDEVGAFVFYVMTYVRGETLAQRVSARGALPASDVMRIMREIAWALGYAHDQGVVHRDVKPANILLDASGRAMVTDFGIARAIEGDSQAMVGELLGTPEYMSPEQASGEHVDGRSDLYALGLVGWFSLTGTVPFTGSTQAVLAQQITRPAPPVSSVARGAPRQLTEAIDRCLLKDSSRRFANGAALADALAPSHLAGAETPAPLRVFIEPRRNAGLVVLPALTGVFAGMMIVPNFGEWPVMLTSSAIGLMGLVAPAAVLVNRLRNLARLGYGPDDIAAALRRDFERRREDFLYDYGPRMSGREHFVRVVTLLVVLLALSAVGNSFMMAERAIGDVTIGDVVTGLLPYGFAAGGLLVLVDRWNRLRANTGSVMARFWDGPIGKLLGRVATWKLRGRAVATERATEVAIAMSAEDMFASLPKDMRRQLGDVPAVLSALRTRATSAREHLAALDDSIAAAERIPARDAAKAKQDALVADLRSAREQVDSRMSDVVTALETIRLDLLRLQAGVGSVEHITLDLAAAEEVGREADRLVAGRREAEAALRRPES